MSKGSGKTCGIVMPISELDGCSANHWAQVLGIMTEPLQQAGFTTRLVSNQGSSPVIQKRIVQNLNTNDIVVCDVSGKNANVMLELGMRLAFDKPVVLVKDDKTGFSFDVSPIEHISYPRDLRFHSILEFQTVLTEKVSKLYVESKKDDYSSYLKSFGEIKIASIETKEVSGDAFIIDELKNIRELIENNLNDRRKSFVASEASSTKGIVVPVGIMNKHQAMTLKDELIRLRGVESVSFDIYETGDTSMRIFYDDKAPGVVSQFTKILRDFREEITLDRKNPR